MQKVLCRIGGWVMPAVPGTEYEFGIGGKLWGPIPTAELASDPSLWCEVEGMATAVPFTGPYTKDGFTRQYRDGLPLCNCGQDILGHGDSGEYCS